MFVCWQHPSDTKILWAFDYCNCITNQNTTFGYCWTKQTLIILQWITHFSLPSGSACLLPLLPSCKWGYLNVSTVHFYNVSAVLENESALKIVGCHHDTSQWYMGTVLYGGFLDTPMYIMIHDCWECSWNGFGRTTFCRHLFCYTQLCAHLYHAVTDQLQMLLCIPVNSYHACTWRLGWKPQNGYSGCSQGEETVVMRSLFW